MRTLEEYRKITKTGPLSTWHGGKACQAISALCDEVERLTLELDAVRRSEKIYRDAWEAIPTGALLDYWYGSDAVSTDAKAAQEALEDWMDKVWNMVNTAGQVTS